MSRPGERGNTMHYAFTDGEIKKLLKSLTVIVDTREQRNGHIIEYLDKHKIPRISKKLDFGDYSCLLPADQEFGFMRDVYCSDTVVIERKASLEELSGNLTHDRVRFESELLRASKVKTYLMIENGSYSDIVEHRYKTELSPAAYIGALKAFEARYNLSVNFIPVGHTGSFIYSTLYYHLREQLKTAA